MWLFCHSGHCCGSQMLQPHRTADHSLLWSLHGTFWYHQSLSSRKMLSGASRPCVCISWSLQQLLHTSGVQPKAVTIAYACESLGQLYHQLKRGPHMPDVKIFVKCLWVLRGALWAQMGNFYLNYIGIFIQWIMCIIDIFRNRCMCEYICNIN